MEYQEKQNNNRGGESSRKGDKDVYSKKSQMSNFNSTTKNKAGDGSDILSIVTSKQNINAYNSNMDSAPKNNNMKTAITEQKSQNMFAGNSVKVSNAKSNAENDYSKRKTVMFKNPKLFDNIEDIKRGTGEDKENFYGGGVIQDQVSFGGLKGIHGVDTQPMKGAIGEGIGQFMQSANTASP